MKTIIGVKLDDRCADATEFQRIITEFGDGIRTRLGLHETSSCSRDGVILLEVVDHSAEDLLVELSGKWDCQKMVF